MQAVVCHACLTVGHGLLLYLLPRLHSIGRILHECRQRGEPKAAAEAMQQLAAVDWSGSKSIAMIHGAIFER